MEYFFNNMTVWAGFVGLYISCCLIYQLTPLKRWFQPVSYLIDPGGAESVAEWDKRIKKNLPEIKDYANQGNLQAVDYLVGYYANFCKNLDHTPKTSKECTTEAIKDAEKQAHYWDLKQFELYEKAYNLEPNSDNTLKLAHIYAAGNIVDKNMPKAIALYQEAGAYYILGKMFYKGDGVDKNLDKAEYYFKKIGSEDDEVTWYLSDINQEQGDYYLANQYLIKTARNKAFGGNLFARRELGERYLEGKYMVQDTVTGYAWLLVSHTDEDILKKWRNKIGSTAVEQAYKKVDILKKELKYGFFDIFTIYEVFIMIMTLVGGFNLIKITIKRP